MMNMKLKLILHVELRVLTDIIVTSRLATVVVVVAITSNLANMSDLTLATDLGLEPKLTYSRTPTLSSLGREPGEQSWRLLAT